MVEPGKPDQSQKTKERRESREQNGELKHHRKPSWNGPDGRDWLGLHHRGVEHVLSDVLQEESRRSAGDASAKNQPWQFGTLDTHGLIQAVNGKGRMAVPSLIACIPHVLGGMIQVMHVLEFSEVAVDSF